MSSTRSFRGGPVQRQRPVRRGRLLLPAQRGPLRRQRGGAGGTRPVRGHAEQRRGRAGHRPRPVRHQPHRRQHGQRSVRHRRHRQCGSVWFPRQRPRGSVQLVSARRRVARGERAQLNCGFGAMQPGNEDFTSFWMHYPVHIIYYTGFPLRRTPRPPTTPSPLEVQQ